MYLLAQPALGPDAEAVADDQHADHQLGADRGTPDLAVERPKVRPEPRKIDDLIDPPKKVIGWDMPLKAELVEQRFLPRPPLAHHSAALRPEND